jgi:NAD(P)-dependent dehydrogenase (short-subunit alcohol dehydrogenase family)
MQLIESSALGYIGQPEDVASTISYLVSKEAHFVTGELPVQRMPIAKTNLQSVCIRTMRTFN